MRPNGGRVKREQERDSMEYQREEIQDGSSRATGQGRTEEERMKMNLDWDRGGSISIVITINFMCDLRETRI